MFSDIYKSYFSKPEVKIEMIKRWMPVPDDTKSLWFPRQVPCIWSHYHKTAQGIE